MKVSARIIKNGKYLSNEKVNKFFIKKLFQLEDQFTREIDKFSSAHKKVKFIQLSSTLSRSIYQSRIYYDYCLLEGIQELIKKGFQVEFIEINQELQSAIKELKARNPNAILKYYVAHKRLNLFKDFMRLIKFTFLKLIQIIFIRLNFQRKLELKECHALFSSYVFQGKVCENNYFGNIVDLPEPKAVFMPVIIDISLSGILDTLKDLKALKNKLIFREHHLSIQDLLKSLSYYFHEKTFAKKINPKNLNDSLIRDHLLKSSFNTLSLEAHLNFLGFSKILKETGSPKKLILSWENQSSEKAIMLAASQYKEIDTCGFVSRPMKQNEFNICPSKQEIENNLSPKNIFVTGNMALERFKNIDSRIRASLGPCLRYMWTYRPVQKISKTKLSNELIFVMPGDEDSFVSLQRTILDLKASNISKQFKIYVKLHPYFKQSKKIYGAEVIDKKIEDLPRGSIIISAASIAALEAAAMGFKTILYFNEYNQYETSIYVKREKYPIPIFQNTPELINRIEEYKANNPKVHGTIQVNYFNNKVNQGIDFFYK